MKFFIRFSYIFLFFFWQLNECFSAICTATASGNWHTASVWSCGHVPACGDHVVIPSGFTVTIASQADYSGCAQTMTVVVQGQLKFVTGNKLKLRCGSMFFLAAGAQIVPGGGGGNSNELEICGDTYWNAGMGTLSGPVCYPPGCSSPLPINLIRFSGIAKKHAVELTWTTNSERDNHFFKIERSTDGYNFYQIGKVNSKFPDGNSNLKTEYTYLDENVSETIYYYRLIQQDFDGAQTVSNIISVRFLKEKDFTFTIYPNPNKGEFTIDFSGLENNHLIKVYLHDINGKIIYTTET